MELHFSAMGDSELVRLFAAGAAVGQIPLASCTTIAAGRLFPRAFPHIAVPCSACWGSCADVHQAIPGRGRILTRRPLRWWRFKTRPVIRLVLKITVGWRRSMARLVGRRIPTPESIESRIAGWEIDIEGWNFGTARARLLSRKPVGALSIPSIEEDHKCLAGCGNGGTPEVLALL